nr:transposase [uncultured Undibacterium sp.]
MRWRGPYVLRIEFAGALYKVTVRGNARANIYGNDDDRQRFLSLLKTAVDRYDWYCDAYRLMDKHYHLFFETNRASLSDSMKLLNGFYTQYANRQYQRGGHVFQGRFKAILVQRESYQREQAQQCYRDFVQQDKGQASPWRSLKNQIYLGDDEFVLDVQRKLDPEQSLKPRISIRI